MDHGRIVVEADQKCTVFTPTGLFQSLEAILGCWTVASLLWYLRAKVLAGNVLIIRSCCANRRPIRVDILEGLSEGIKD
jgi:hypothetical protein